MPDLRPEVARAEARTGGPGTGKGRWFRELAPSPWRPVLVGERGPPVPVAGLSCAPILPQAHSPRFAGAESLTVLDKCIRVCYHHGRQLNWTLIQRGGGTGPVKPRQPVARPQAQGRTGSQVPIPAGVHACASARPSATCKMRDGSSSEALIGRAFLMCGGCHAHD
jgi:hypothetical protein